MYWALPVTCICLCSAYRQQFGAYSDRITLHNMQSCVFFGDETVCRLRLKCDGTRAETSFRLSAKRESPFKSARGSVQSTTGRRAVHISLQGLYCSREPVFCSHVTLTGYPLHSLFSSPLLLTYVTVCHHISKAVYIISIQCIFLLHWLHGPCRNLASFRINFQAALSLASFLHLLIIIMFRKD